MEKREKWFFVVAALLILLVVGSGLWMRKSDENGPKQDMKKDETPSQANFAKTDLVIEDIVVGKGEEASAGAKITVNYKGTLVDGTKFDSSYDRNQPFQFVLGAGQVIAGWDQGFAGMKVGGKRKLTIPPELGYGDRATGSIPAGSTLIFEVELLAVSK